MGQKNSKDENVYQQVIEGNVEAIKALCNQGAKLEWIDKEGKTPLIVACMDARLYIVAKTLIELGANVNAYRPGAHAGTPLHHAAKRGLDHTVKLLLSHGANPFARNDDVQTPLDIARTKGHFTVVRAMEAHISYYSGNMREMVVPRLVGSLMPQSFARKSSKKCYVVVAPYDSPNTKKPPKLELTVYSSPQDAQPHSVIPLWKSSIAEPKFHEADPSFTIFNESTRTRYRFLSAIEGDRQQLVQLYSACKGAPKVMPSPELSSTGVSPLLPEVDTSNQPGSTSGSNSQASITTNGWGDIDGNSTHNEWGPSHTPPPSKATYNGWADVPKTEEYNGWADPGSSTPIVSHTTVAPAPPLPAPTAPSAPPLPMDIVDEGPIHYPSVDMGYVDMSTASGGSNGKTHESCCVVCWEAPVEGACVPCGHMAGCMSCLLEIKSKRGDCPVCRAKIDQVIKLYAV